ncbi:MAG TPA: AarF/UbiB family protein [Streptosporangiaceae bacterium]
MLLAAQSSPVGGVVMTIAVLVISVAVVAGLAWAARRLLGLPVGTLRALVAGLLGFAAAELFGRWLLPAQTGHVAAFFTVALGIPLVVAMIFIVAAEVLFPSGTGPQPVDVVRNARRALARSRRYSQISRIAVQHGLGPYLRGRRLRPEDAAGGRAALAASLRSTLEAGGVTFTKLGQLLSTRRDLLPEEFTAELARLQDRAEPAPWDQVREVLAQSLGVPVDQVFAELEPEPAAAASIAQVHKARLRCADGPGDVVAVKVQRPGIRATVEQDLDILQRLAARLEKRAQWARAVGAVGVARGFAAAMREELDFRVEASNMAVIAATWPAQQRAVGGRIRVMMPTLHQELSTEHVLVIEWLDGVSLRAAGPLLDDRGLDRAELTGALLRSMVYQITEGGAYHADPHPGNVLLLADGRLALLDFGSVGRLDAQQRAALQNLLLAVGRGDPAALRDALLELVTRTTDIDEQQLERALGQFMARHLAVGLPPSAEIFTDLFRLASRFRLAIPPEIGTVLRALATLEGTLSELEPDFDIVTQAREYAATHVTAQLTPKTVQKTAADELLALAPVLRRLPRRLDRISGALEQGRLGVNVRLFADERDRRVVTGLTNQFLLTFLGAATGIMAALLLGVTAGPQIASDVSLAQLIGYNLLLVASILVLRVLFTIFRNR